MKKSVLLLSMLLGSAVVFGQSPNKSATIRAKLPVQGTEKAYSITKESNILKAQSYKGTILTKTEPFYTQTFSTLDSFKMGQISPSGNINPVVNGQFVWLSDSTLVAFNDAKTWNNPTNPTQKITVPKPIAYDWHASVQSTTPRTGSILISPLDNFPGVGGTNVTGLRYDAYAQIMYPINTTAITGAIDVEFYQYMRRFNNDKFFVEWSTDETTWNAVEVNVRGLDMATNDGFNGRKRVTIPSGATGQATLYLRFRYTGTATAGTQPQPAGYFWVIDDLTLTQAPEGRLSSYKQTFSDGGYHVVPANLRMPAIRWSTYSQSTGADNALNAEATVSIPEDPILTGISNKIASMPLNQINPFSISKDTISFIDPHYINDTLDTLKLAAQQNLSFPSDPSMPQYTITSRINADNTDPYYFRDTFNVNVNGANNPYKRSWGRDNGFLAYGAKFNMAIDGAYITHEDEFTENSSYKVCLAYQVDANAITSDFPDGIWANGVEMISSQYSEPGYDLITQLVQDSTAGGYIYFVNRAWNIDEDGNGPYTVQSSDIPNIPAGGYLLNPPTIFVPFKDPVKLSPGETYRVCYSPYYDNTIFMLGADGMGSPRLPNFTTGRRYNMYIVTTDPNTDLSLLESAQTPMIRLVVGPGKITGIQDVAKVPSFKLKNYPNPAKEMTTIEYTLPNSGNVTIEVRDLMGRILKSENLGMKTAEGHTYELKTSTLPNGTYFYSVIVNGSVQTKKLVISK